MHVQRKSGVRRNERVVGAGPLGDLMRTLSFVLSARKPVWALPPGKCWIIIMPFHETPLATEQGGAAEGQCRKRGDCSWPREGAE